MFGLPFARSRYLSNSSWPVPLFVKRIIQFGSVARRSSILRCLVGLARVFPSSLYPCSHVRPVCWCIFNPIRMTNVIADLNNHFWTEFSFRCRQAFHDFDIAEDRAARWRVTPFCQQQLVNRFVSDLLIHCGDLLSASVSCEWIPGSCSPFTFAWYPLLSAPSGRLSIRVNFDWNLRCNCGATLKVTHGARARLCKQCAKFPVLSEQPGISKDFIFSLEGWGERRGLNPRPSVPQTDALPAELRSPQTKYTQFRPHSVFSKARTKDWPPALKNRALPFIVIGGTKQVCNFADYSASYFYMT